MNYTLNILAALSVVLNALTGGSYRNTFSARCGYAHHNQQKAWAKVAVKVIDFLFLPFGKKHCYHEYMNEIDTFH